MTQALFPRNFRKRYPEAVRGEGCYIFSSDGRKLLDAAGSAAVVSIGHGVAAIGRAMAEQARELAFAHTSQFQTPVAERLAARLLALAPLAEKQGARVYFTSGGSEATESALKLSRQYFVELGQAQRTRFVSRWQSYHGSTLAALSVSGNLRRRAPFEPVLADWGHIAPCYCYRCPLGLTYPRCDVACADELEKFIRSVGPETVAAFVLEPVVGATLGGVAPPEGYLQRIAEICRRYGILLIADEVMTGMGRTGRPFAVEHWGIQPDLILVGKAVASGYAPLGAVLVSGHIVATIAQGSGAFLHGFTYSAHAVAMAAGNSVLDYLEQQHLFERVTPVGEELLLALAPLRQSAMVGDLRGLGLLLGIEFVRDAATREPFPAEARVAERVYEAALEQGILTYPIQGCADGECGDHILLAPPFIVSVDEIQTVAQGLAAAIERVSEDLKKLSER